MSQSNVPVNCNRVCTPEIALHVAYEQPLPYAMRS